MSYEGTIVYNYRLGKKLGEGGFGAVYLAEHVELGRKAACKILHREYASKPEVVERFFREARSACAIGHRAIIDIENFGRLEQGEPFYLMEFFPGESLAERTSRGPLPTASLVAVFDAVASALAAAHAKQIIHRDLKPENIMILEEGGAIRDVKLLDFGIAKLVGEHDGVRSRSGIPMGTPSYMSPEQALDSKSVDARTDVYSFAATVYAAIAGTPPFTGDGLAAVLLKVQTDAPTPLTRLVPSAPIQLERVLMRCLEKRPDARPVRIEDAWQEIRHALAGAGQFVPPAALGGVAATLPPDAATIYPAPVVPGASAPPIATTLGAAAAESTRGGSRSRWPVAIVAVGAIAAAIVIVVMMRKNREQPVVADQPAPPPAEAAVPDADVDAVVAVAIDAPPEPVAKIETPPDAAVKPAKKPKTEPKPVVEPAKPPPEQPSLVCTPASFAAVYERAAPAESEVRAALNRLNRCRSQLPAEKFQQIQQNLVSKL